MKIEHFESVNFQKLAGEMVGREEPTITRHEGRLIITAKCVVTGKPYSVGCGEEDYKRWQAGELIQRAMPYLSPGDREFLISGTSPEGWEKLFGKEDE